MIEPVSDIQPAVAVDSWSHVSPRFEWRASQRHLLEQAARIRDHKWHLVAPPGEGKTLIGLELARGVALPTLVLSPTTGIRDQWREAMAMFGTDPATFTSDDPRQSAPLIAVTYQILGNPGEATTELRSAARRLWLAEVTSELGPEAAATRMAATEKGDPDRAERELHRHVRALRRSLATGEDIGLPRAALLGERATDLVEQLAKAGIGCVILDECHHLLDWWALVAAVLVERLRADREVALIGLTATPPDPDSEEEAQNFRGLLGDVDAELHLAAVVAEGALAPWRDGLRVTELCNAEQAFLNDWTRQFAAELDDRLIADPFLDWAVAQVSTAALDARADLRAGESDPAAWDAFWDRDPLAAASLARWWRTRGLALPAGFDAPPGVEGALDLQDRLVLVDAWLHDPDALLDQQTRQDIHQCTARCGISFTTRGIRWGRSVADLVCARSSAKGEAAGEIIAAEAKRRGAALRALVVVERDTATTPPAAAREVLGEDAGTAARALAALCAHSDVVSMGVVAVTGRGGWADALSADRACAVINTCCGNGGRWVRAEGCDIRGAVRLAGEGPGWTSARWLAAAEAVLDDGIAQVLVATRGLVGEGWDYPPLNVLIDLSEETSSAATTQLRGRALRLNPAEPTKVASLWDVAVAHPSAVGDWARLRRRHERWWGPAADGAIVTGPEKLHPLAGRAEPPNAEERHTLNEESMAAVADENATRAAWAKVDPGGVGAAAVHMRPRRRRRRVRTRGRMWPWLRGAATGTAVSGVVVGVAAASTAALWPVAAACGLGTIALGGMARGRRRGERDTLEALADAVLAGLVAAGNDEFGAARVVVASDPAGGWVALLEDAQDDAATCWADALAETLGRLGTPRWIVAVDERAWRVPTAFDTTQQAAEAFARAFRSRVPGAQLIRAGTPRATELVLAAARERPDEIGRSLHWRCAAGRS